MLLALSTRVVMLEIKKSQGIPNPDPVSDQNTPISTPLWFRFLTKTAQRKDTLWGGTQ